MRKIQRERVYALRKQEAEAKGSQSINQPKPSKPWEQPHVSGTQRPWNHMGAGGGQVTSQTVLGLEES